MIFKITLSIQQYEVQERYRDLITHKRLHKPLHVNFRLGFVLLQKAGQWICTQR